MSQIELLLTDTSHPSIKKIKQSLPIEHYKVTSFDDAETLLIYFMKTYRHHHHPKCAIIKHKLTGMSGIEALEHLKKLDKNIPSIIYSENPTPRSILEAWRADVDQFLICPFDQEEFLSVLHKAINKQKKENSLLAGFNPDAVDNYKSLTNRERQTMQFIIDGKTSGQIAKNLNISIPTVKMHRANLMRKLGVHNTAQLSSLYHNSLTPHQSTQ